MLDKENIYKWVKIISITGGVQILVQILGLVSGIYILRSMSSQEYSYYTIANTMLGTLTVLTDGGVTSAVLSKGGQVWGDKKKLGVVIATGMYLRNRFAILSLLVSIPVLFYLLMHQNAKFYTALLISLSLIPAFYASLSDSLLEIPLKLNQDLIPLQKNQFFTSFVRLILSCIGMFCLPFCYVALLSNGVPRIWANFKLKKINNKYLDSKASFDKIIRKDILAFVSRILPGSIYYCFSGQITVWLLSLFGNNQSIAQLGGLGRLSMLLTLFGVLFSTLIVPQFAKTFNSYSALIGKFWKIQIGVFIFFFVFVFLLHLIDSQLLWILGSQFSSLKTELILSMIGSCIGIMSGFSFSLYTSKGWAIYPYISIPLNVFSIIIGIFLFKINSLRDVLHFSIFTSSIQYIINSYFCFYKIRELKF